jgi:hypothetical protein
MLNSKIEDTIILYMETNYEDLKLSGPFNYPNDLSFSKPKDCPDCSVEYYILLNNLELISQITRYDKTIYFNRQIMLKLISYFNVEYSILKETLITWLSNKQLIGGDERFIPLNETDWSYVNLENQVQ